MAIVRCDNHPVDPKRATNTYVMRVKPLGYPQTAAICGRSSCELPGLVWLTSEELSGFRTGERYFRVKTYTVKVKVSDHLLSLPSR